MFKFEVSKQSRKSKARIGKITTPHGEIITPAFIPVATLGVIKGGMDFEDTAKVEAQCQITNTFHFLDLDRVKEIKKLGGLHKFFNFNKPIFTDSGGFQVFSLGKGMEFGLSKVGDKKESGKVPNGKNLVKISEDGVKFRSPRNGREISLTPEISAQAQMDLGADFIYMLDVCGSPSDSYEEVKKNLDLTNFWYKKFLSYIKKNKIKNQQVFGIVQGGKYDDLRVDSVKKINELPVFGIAIGGEFADDKNQMIKTISKVTDHSDRSRPHHLLGIGDLESIPLMIKAGIDVFDCAMPTRIARHGTALTKNGNLNLNSGKFRNKFLPIDKNCECFACKNYSIGQINFLLHAKEQLAGKLLTMHNIFFIENYLKEIRQKINSGRF
ncbi:MAG: tRNA guanosine(34) transglycosylase Tgt [Candidatus Pacebacteria bacterium]|nr:tRNA guanosine(34) transglycosylase Tgt [Candidatus Paceibacterota bacterium]